VSSHEIVLGASNQREFRHEPETEIIGRGFGTTIAILRGGGSEI
jgi:hypothetical protein